MKCCYPLVAPGSDAKIMAMGGNFDRNIALLGELGFDGVELMVRDTKDIPEPVLRKALSDNGLSLAAVGVMPAVSQDKLKIASPSADIRRRAMTCAYNAIDLAASFGASFCIGSFRGSVDEPSSDNTRAHALESFREISQYAKERGVSVLIEPQGTANGNYLNSVGEVVTWIQQIGGDNVGMILDLYHMAICERSIFSAIQASANLIGLVHLCDSNRLIMGYGHLPACEYIGAIASVGFDGFYSVEVQQVPDGDTPAKMSAQFFDYYRRVFLK